MRSLGGKAILLSAGVPEPDQTKYRLFEDSPGAVAEAVISLARATYARNGRLVLGWHPSLAPLVIQVVTEYAEPRFLEEGGEQRAGELERARERPVVIYKSRVFEEDLPDFTSLTERMGYAQIVETDRLEGEKYLPSLRYDLQGPKSLRHMRERMLKESHPVAMVAIGGMEGVEEESSLFLEIVHQVPLYVIAGIGGAAALLGERRDRRIRSFDEPQLRSLHEFRQRYRSEEGRRDEASENLGLDGEEDEVPYAVHAYVMQRLVEEIAERE